MLITIGDMYKLITEVRESPALFSSITSAVTTRYPLLSDMLAEHADSIQGDTENTLFYSRFYDRVISPCIRSLSYRESTEPTDLAIDALAYTSRWLTSNAYKVGIMYDTMMHEYNPIENYDRYEERESSDSSEGTGSEVYGAKSYTKGAQVNNRTGASTIGAHTDESSYGQSTTTHTAQGYTDEHRQTVAPFTSTQEKPQGTMFDVMGSRSESDSTGAHTDSLSYGQQSNSTTDSYTDGQRTDSETAHTDTHTASEERTGTENAHIHGNIGVTTAPQMLTEQRKLAMFNFWGWLYTELVNDMCEGVL